jgi:OPT family oligopeptide transporter
MVGSSAISSPWWATVNLLLGAIFWQWLFIPICYYMNIFKTPQLQSVYNFEDGSPFGILNNNKIFNSTGHRIYIRAPNSDHPEHRDHNSILNANHTLNMEKFRQQGPFFLSEYFAVTYFRCFVNISAVMVHVFLWYGSEIIGHLKAAFSQKRVSIGRTDVHNQLNSIYADINEWVLAGYLLAATLFLVLVCQLTPFILPYWAVILSMLMVIFTIIPIGLIQAVTGTQAVLNVSNEWVGGLLLEGKTVQVMCFKSLGYNLLVQPLSLIADLKLGHYLHIPPLAMLASQFIGTVIGILFNTTGALLIMKSFAPFTNEHPEWLATTYNTFVSSGGIWGAIGPRRMFGSGSPYEYLVFGFLIGVLLPIIPWYINKLHPNNFWKLVNMPLLTGVAFWPGRYLSALLPLALSGFVTQFYLLRYKRAWFDKYNYILAVGADSGMVVAMVFITIFSFYLYEIKKQKPVNFFSPLGAADYYCHDSSYYDPK